MDSSDISIARGVPCAFEQYEVLQDGEWQEVVHGIPTNKDRIRFGCESAKKIRNLWNNITVIWHVYVIFDSDTAKIFKNLNSMQLKGEE
ncbi:hypothetical protein [Metabacillus lacus]|uniref:hypothetical protein n=1 Tax=Metabacillus lacus TaxID=1983721 RepID=UPI001BA48561|nr:hypothetical protein [Metabacillus lacus]